MNKEITRPKKDKNKKRNLEKDLDEMVEKMSPSRQSFYWRKGHGSNYNKDFRNPIRH